MEAQVTAPNLLPAPADPTDAPPLRWGILGAGGIARRFAREVPARSAQQVLAVASRDQRRADAFAAEHGVGRAYGSYELLVTDEDVDVVYIATPHSAHRDHALLALEAGKHVLVEKAFTRNADEALEVLDAARERHLFVMEAMWTRFLPHMVALRGLIGSGALGEILAVTADHGQRLDTVERLLAPELAGGALLDLGVYPVSFAYDVLGAPASVHAAGALTDVGVDAHEAVTLTYAGTRAVAVCTSNMWATTATTASVVGTEGRVDIDGPFYRPTSFTVTPFSGAPWRFEPVPGITAADGGFEFQAAEVARCVADGRRESVDMPWRATLEVMEVLDEVRRQLGVVYPGE
ncbi:Gfo/Idh/MocA family oxidoreductase [Georgenia yuyongxinii]|uniref:Gfo/Idh/MocA family oxidoreductase n=1 Tax=Georgenia yuyongxinii TaxID=2589797 RepID=A0A5B8C255_9MICO|nr:Gfo/Idh/MocA family oxidoreductase [Georgenia yuyongxinii]QDC23591.1 Gfo/Idh/MocA family oxidoreductase [Georgenia yuyongxinii]